MGGVRGGQNDAALWFWRFWQEASNLKEPSQKLLLDVRELSALTGLSVGTLYHLVSQKRIPVVRLSARCIRFRLCDLERWLTELTEPAKDIVKAYSR